MRVKRKLNKTGQLSIFAILIFQTLFTLFGMSLNIALVVHDKINLQNSVDLAAYYGAMKQAEMMNAIAHINYQIRQSWKLLVWRYRVLGSMGMTHTPWKEPGTSDRPYSLPAYCDHQQIRPNSEPGPYFFCVGHRHWGGFFININEGLVEDESGDDNLCKCMQSSISALHAPVPSGVTGPHSNMFIELASAVDEINRQVQERCNRYGLNSWLLGLFSLWHFHNDQSVRKRMIYQLAQKLSEGKDMDGYNIFDGVKKTFQKNLTYINNSQYNNNNDRDHEDDGTQLEGHNSLKGKAQEDWLQDHPFFLAALYSKLSQGGNSDESCAKALDYIRHPPLSPPNDLLSYFDPFLEIIQTTHFSWPECIRGAHYCAPSMGLSKKPNHIIYYAVKAELNYTKQIFWPFVNPNAVTIKAMAIAKPFGGRIGPPQDAEHTTWRPPSSTSGISLTDSYRIDKLHTPNYSRYPGDRVGLRSEAVQAYWAKYLQQTSKIEKDVNSYIKTDYYEDQDPLARQKLLITGGGVHALARKWELAAIAPDLFDIAYYTILPNYQEAYFPKIERLLTGLTEIRGDLGAIKGAPPVPGGILYSVGVPIDRSRNLEVNQSGHYGRNVWQELQPIMQQPWYKIRSANFLFTGWNPPNRKYENGTNYNDLDNSNFVKQCDTWSLVMLGGQVPDNKRAIANGCVIGGRTGYSVKLVSKKYVKGGRDAIKYNFPQHW